MSGIEAAGFILGAIPLVISGLEHYSEGVSTIKVMFRYRQEFANLSRKLQTEEALFSNTIELLLRDCVEDTVLAELLNHPNGKQWSSPDLETALKEKLKRSYWVYLESVKAMNKALDEFRSRLKLSPDGKGPFHDPKSFKEAYTRFRFGLKKAQYMDLLDEITSVNTSLAKLTEQSKSLEPFRRSRRRVPNFSKMRTQAASIFGILQKCLHGSCQAAHKASISIKGIDDYESDEREMTCRVVMHHDISASGPNQPPLWIIEETEMRLLKSGVLSQATPGATDPSLRKRNVQFTVHSTMPVLPSPDLSNLEEIHDLCLSFERLRAKQCGVCLGYLVDSAMDRYALYWPQKPVVDKTSLSMLSLADLFTEPRQNPQLSGGDSRRLAAALAFGMLRLHDTPWLTTQWSHRDIELYRKDGAILLDHPFVSAKVGIHSAVQSTPSPPSPMIKNETVFALGILLIELCLETSFAELQKTSGDLNADGSKHALSDFLTATRAIDKVYDKYGDRYGKAVRRCIHCDFDQSRTTTLKNDAFRAAVYDGVVAVLEEEVRQFFGQT